MAITKTRKIRKARGRPRADEVDDRVGHILDVAEMLIVRDGYQAVSVDAIARAAQISKKTIYSQFENKAGLLAAVVDRLAKSRSAAQSPDHPSLREGLLHRARVILDASYDETTIRLDIVLFREGRMFPELGQTFERAAREQYIKPVEDYLAACAKRGMIRASLNSAFAAEAFVHLLTADIIIKTAMGEAPKMSATQRRALAERVCDLFIGGVR